MMNNYQDGINKKLFLIPYILFVVLYSTLLIWFGNNHLNAYLQQFETDAIGIAEGYAQSIAKSEEARTILNEMLDSRLAVAGESIARYEGEYTTETLIDLARRYRVDAIYIYNRQGEIIHSNGQYVGWKAYDGHPVYQFMTSGETFISEEIRPDSESGILYKFAYYMLPNGVFVQIGVLAEKVDTYLGRFDAKELINDLQAEGIAHQVFFLDNNNNIIYCTAPELIGKEFQVDPTEEVLGDNIQFTSTEIIEGLKLNIVKVPVKYDNIQIGTLVFGKSIEQVEAYMRNFVIIGMINFVIISIVFGLILLKVYNISKANYSIAYYDQLTGLPNQNHMLEYMEKRIQEESTKNRAIFLINCINFKRLNLVYGYDYGNVIIKEIAAIVGSLVEGYGTLFRFELDRFIVCIKDYKDKDQLEKYAYQIDETFKNPLINLGKQLYVNVGVGIVEITKDDRSIQSLLKKAVIAVDHVEKNSMVAYSFYGHEMEAKIQRKEMIERDLRSILVGDNSTTFFLEFQPQLDLKTNKISGFEALARLNSKQLGSVSPVEFIEVAEQKLLIEHLGYMIIQKASLFLLEMASKGFEHIKVAVNVSGYQLLRDDFVDKFIEITSNNNVCNSNLEIEITESVFLENYQLVNDKLEALSQKEIEVSLDDFGTGYSSLSSIRDLKIQKVKIDRSFINKTNQLHDMESITTDVISMAHKLGLKVVAEGVETEVQKEYLVEHGCDIIQGYLFSKPLSQERAIDLLLKTNL